MRDGRSCPWTAGQGRGRGLTGGERRIIVRAVPRPSLSRRGFALTSLVLAGCAGRVGAPQRLAGAAGASAASFAADPRIGQYVSSAWTFATSSFWISGPAGLVLVDTQFLPSGALEAAALAEQATGQRLVTAFVLHANPDKFNGTSALQRRGAQVLTSRQVLAAMPAIHEKRVAAFYERYKPDYPLEMPTPAAFGAATTQLRAAGLPLTAHVLGPGCSDAHVVLQFEDQLFVGDLVANGAHSWLEIGRTDAWLQRIAELEALRPRFVHPGRGPSGGPELLTRQRVYLEQVIALVAAEQPSGPPDKAALARVRAALELRYPGHRFPVFLEIGLPAEWRRQAGAAAVD
jgi:glyoxylase-like metal-dependent hydrolase (beta-lactamase superfamily II)